MSIVDSLRRARQNARITLTVAAERSGVGVTNLSAIENERRDPTTTTVERLANAIGVTFVPIQARGRHSAAEHATAISFADRSDNPELAYRQFIQLADDLAAVDPVTRVVLSAEEPENTPGRWNHAIAALVEYRLAEVSAPIPDWVSRCVGLPADTWEPQRGQRPLPFAADRAEVAAPFLRRGVLIEENELVSI